MAGRPGPVVPMPEFGAEWKAAVEERRERLARRAQPVRVAWFHVVGVVGHHPRNKWVKLPSGLYDLNGSAYAFNDDQVQACPEPGGGRCGCVLPELISRYDV